MKYIATIVILLSTLAYADSWTVSSNKCPNNLSTMLLLRDGRLLISNPDLQGIWLAWTPDQYGSYENGTCTRVADMPAGYSPRAFGSVVGTDGKAYIFGGEYNVGCQDECWVNKSAVYDSKANTWTMIPPPVGWTTIGDAASTMLPNGKILQLNCCSPQSALFNTATGQWEPGPNTLGTHHESSDVLMHNGKVLLIDTDISAGCGNSTTATEIYDYVSNTWTCGPDTPIRLWDYSDKETGPPVMLPDGTLYAGGGWLSGSAILNTATMLWDVGPIVPGMNQDEIPATVLPDGTVLMGFRTFDRQTCQFEIYDPTTRQFTPAANPLMCPDKGNQSSSFRMVMLPTGQVAFSHVNHWIEFYSSDHAPLTAAAPKILALSSPALHSGSTYTLFGYQLNGLSQGSMKDDDAQMATNYPLVQLQDAQGHVLYAPTHNDSYSGIKPGTVSSVQFDVPLNASTGKYVVRVVTNGIASNPVSVAIAAPRL